MPGYCFLCRKNANAFTLIEILVVIAIIALLAAILFPVFGRVRENSRRTSCGSNLKQIGMGITQYTQDYDEILPGVGEDFTPVSWRTRLQPYLKSTQVFTCPTTGWVSSVNPTRRRETLLTDGIAGSYAANGGRDAHFGSLGGPCNNLTDYPQRCTPMGFGLSDLRGKNLAALEAPAETLLVTESGVQEIMTIDFTTTDGNIWAGHMGTMNVLFGDGHVKAMSPLATATPKNMWTIMDDGLMPTTVTAWTGANGLVFQDKRYKENS